MVRKFRSLVCVVGNYFVVTKRIEHQRHPHDILWAWGAFRLHDETHAGLDFLELLENGLRRHEHHLVTTVHQLLS